MSLIDQIYQDSYHGSDNEEIHQGIVDLSGLEHPLGPDCAPDQGGIVDYLGAVAGEALLVGWGA